MSKKLTTQALVLCLVIAFGGTVFAGTPYPAPDRTTHEIGTPGISQGRGIELDLRADPESLQKSRTVSSEPMDLPAPQGEGTDHLCEILDYTDYDGSFYSVRWAGTDADIMATSFEVQALHSKTILKGATIRIYDHVDFEGDGIFPDVVITVYDDAGGVPGLVVYTETYSGVWLQGALPPTMSANLLFPFATELDMGGDPYFISIGTGNEGSADDYIVFGLNQNVDGTSNGRAVYSDGTGYYDPQDVFGIPLNLRVGADVCYQGFSDCYTKNSLEGGTGYVSLYLLPDNAWDQPGVMDGFAAQMVTEGSDTLKSIIVQHIVPEVFGYPKFSFYDAASTNGLEVSIWADDGTGNMDLSGPLATETVPGGIANLYPVTGNDLDNGMGYWDYVNVDFSSHNLVFRGPWHVSVKMTSDDAANGGLFMGINSLAGNPGFSGGSLNFHPEGGADNWQGFDTSPFWTSSIYTDNSDHNFLVHANVCPDEFDICSYQFLYNSYPPNWDWITLGDPSNTFCDGVAQRVDARRGVARPEMVRFQVEEGVGTPGIRLLLYDASGLSYDDASTAPGNVLWSTDITDPVWYPGWNEVVVDAGENFYINGDFFVGYEIILNDPADECYVLTEDATGYTVNGGALFNHNAAGAWIDMDQYWGYTDNLIMEVEFCLIPPDKDPCPNTDWSTLQGDFARTGRAGMGFGDDQCELTKTWEYEHPWAYSQYVGPIVYDQKLIATFRSAAASEYIVFDLASKIEQYTISVPGDVRGVPTAAYSSVLDMDLLLVTGGDKSMIVAAYDINTGTQIWNIAAGDLPGMSTSEENPYGNFIIIDDILYFTTAVGKVFAVNLADGLPGFWPIDYYQIAAPGPTNYRTGCTDGTNLFYAYSTIFGGDVASISAADGSENWLLSTDGLKGIETFLPGPVTVEQFSGGISYDDGYVYCLSNCVSDVPPIASVFYKINALTGETEAWSKANSTSWSVHPVVDMNYVYAAHAPSGSYWVNEINPGDIQAFNKETAQFEWGVMFGEDHTADMTSAEMLLTCEPPGVANKLYIFTSRGYLRCIDTELHEQIFRRRITDATYGGACGAVGITSLGEKHLVFQTAGGKIIDLTTQYSRPRLEILSAENRAPVPFGSNNPFSVRFDDVFTNTGCEDLAVEITISEASNGSPAPLNVAAVDIIDATTDLADHLTKSKGSPFAETADELGSKPLTDRAIINNAALADMSWILTPTLNFTLAPGDVADITVDVDQASVGRGIFHFWAGFTTTNDPDYWLDTNDSPPPPEVKLTFLGGCLVESTQLLFGEGLIHSQHVFNTGRLGVDNEVPTYEGNAGAFFQGALIMGAGEHRISLSTHNWLGGDESDAYVSWMGEQYNGECVPELEEDIPLGAWSEDGITYTPIMGNIVRNNSIDSIQNFDDGAGGWDWNNVAAPYDNELTMGLTVHHKTIGAYDFGTPVDMIGNATVEILQVTERNGEALPGWYLGNYIDYDIGNTDTAWGDFDISAGFCYGLDHGGLRDMMGMIKIPFGCGQTPMLNVWSIDQDSGMWTGVPFLEDCYEIMQAPQGNYARGASTPAPDMAASFTLASHDFTPGETFTTAVAYYWVQDYPTAHTEIARLAHQLNKWMGYGRGDVNNDDIINLTDIIYLANHVGYGGAGPIPFAHLGDVNASGAIDGSDVTYLVDYYFNGGACPLGEMLHAD